MNFVASLSSSAYRAHQTLWSAWARRRYAVDLQRVARFCLLVGFSGSGERLVSALLDAHRNAVIADALDVPALVLAGCTKEELYSRILARAHWPDLDSRNRRHRVPDQWQGRFGALHVIGDDDAAAVTRAVAAHPHFLERVRALVGVPIRLVHVVRNPFDEIAALATSRGLSPEDGADLYFSRCDTTARLGDSCDPAELIVVGREALCDDPRAALVRLCAFLELEPYAGYAEDCCGVVFAPSAYARMTVAWSARLIALVERRARKYPFLDGYGYDVYESRASATRDARR